MLVSWIVSDFGHYHAARMRALVSSGRHALSVVQLRNHSGFPEFGAATETLAGIRCRTLFGPGESRASISRLRAALYSALDDERPDVLFVNGWSHGSAILAMAWSTKRRIPFVIVSASTIADRPRVAWKETLKRALVRRASAAFVGGTRQEQYVCALGMPGPNVFKGCDAVDNRHFADGADAARSAASQVRVALNLPPRYFLCVARLIPCKRLDLLLNAFARYRTPPSPTDVALLFVGDGDERARLAQQATELGIAPWVHFRGFQPYDRLPSLYGLAEALILPSSSESWGLVVNEAMASALPVLVSASCGCVDDLVRHGYNGFVIDPSDVNGLAEQLRMIAENAAHARAMGCNAREDIEAWGLGRFTTGCWGAAEAAVRIGSARRGALDVSGLELLARTRQGLP